MKKIVRAVVCSVFGYFTVAGILLLFAPEAPTGKQKSLNFSELARTDTSNAAPLQTMRARDGGTLSYAAFASDASRVLILLHGSGYHGAYLAPLARRIAAQNLATVYLPNIRGHHGSGPTRGDIDHIDRLTEDLADFIAFVRKKRRDRYTIVAGHSSGGGLAVRFAGSPSGADADAYMLLAPYLGHNSPTARENSGGWAYPSLPRIIGLSMLNTIGISHFNDLPTIAFYMPPPYRNGTETLSYSYRLMTGYAPHRDFKSDIKALPRNSLTLVGSADKAFDGEAYPPLFADLGAPPPEVLQGLTHFGVVTEPVAWQAMENWISKLPTTRP